jgi:hypothetical protein
VKTVARVASAPVPTPWATVTVETPRPTRAPAARTAPRKPAPPAPVPPPPAEPLDAFHGLGAWADVYDYDNDPATIVPLVRLMAVNRVRVLYIETSRRSDPHDIAYPAALGAAIDEAKARGMRVVGWYPPDFTNVALDVHRSLAAIRFRSPGGNHIDAFGADIESTDVRDPRVRNVRLVQYSHLLRQGAGVPLAAIVYPPTQIQRSPSIWPGYPWRTFGTYYDVVMGMHYWTFQTSDPRQVFASTLRNTALIRAFTGRPGYVIGGLAGDANPAETTAYATAVVESGGVGGSLYDARTTSTPEWATLAILSR